MKKEIGIVIHYFNNIGVAIIELSGTLRVNDEISVEGGEKEFVEKINSMEMEKVKIKEAFSGDVVGIKLEEKVKKGYKIYKI